MGRRKNLSMEEELKKFMEETHKNIEKTWGKKVLEQFKELTEKEKDFTKELERIKELSELVRVNFGLEYHVDDVYAHLYIYPVGIKNQREQIYIFYSEESDMYHVNGHGDKTNINYVCGSTEDEILYCILSTIDKFRKDNGWTWEMPCELRLKNKDLN